MLKVSVVVPTFNRSELLTYTLHSLKAQNTPRDFFEVIVADDGSTDNTEEVVRQFEKQLNIRYVYQQDLGYRPGSARNLGVTSSRGKICLLIDSGVLVGENCIAEHISFHEKNSRAAAIGYVYGFEEDNENRGALERNIDYRDVQGSIRRLSNYPAYADVREPHYRKYKNVIHHLPAPWLFFWTCHVSALRKDLLKIGLFDWRYDGRWGVEDTDLGFRLFHDGVSIMLLTEATSIHYPHQKCKHDRHKEGLQNCRLFHEKFKTIGTSIFLDHFMENSFFDLNQRMLELGARDVPLEESNVLLEPSKIV